MCVHMYIHMYIHVYIHMYIHNVHTHVDTHVHTHVHTRTYTCTYKYTYPCIVIDMYMPPDNQKIYMWIPTFQIICPLKYISGGKPDWSAHCCVITKRHSNSALTQMWCPLHNDAPCLYLSPQACGPPGGAINTSPVSPRCQAWATFTLRSQHFRNEVHQQ